MWAILLKADLKQVTPVSAARGSGVLRGQCRASLSALPHPACHHHARGYRSGGGIHSHDLVLPQSGVYISRSSVKPQLLKLTGDKSDGGFKATNVEAIGWILDIGVLS